MKRMYISPEVKTIAVSSHNILAGSNPTSVSGGTGNSEITNGYADGKRSDLWDFSDSEEE